MINTVPEVTQAPCHILGIWSCRVVSNALSPESTYLSKLTLGPALFKMVYNQFVICLLPPIAPTSLDIQIIAVLACHLLFADFGKSFTVNA
ncbi:Uncharacterised protein [Yersinia aldovae]|uniref:Uncharacterized protein n=1 Tax=Yersinia aldovae TaxID=29483 RepID=A0A0T9TZW3_YERAL|nr:Uncharacterised protein [Yersinia aldovae]